MSMIGRIDDMIDQWPLTLSAIAALEEVSSLRR